MQIINPFQMNNWKIKNLLKFVLFIQVSIWALTILDSVNLQIPILTQLIGFIYLIFVPGILIIRIFRLNFQNNIETMLYAVGLSISSIMFIGLFMNIFYPYLGIKPISLVPTIVTISIFILSLCIFCYIKDNNFSNENYINLKSILSPIPLLLILIPFLSIFGTYLLNVYGINEIQMLYLVIIALLIPISLKWMPKKYYPLLVFVISISLLYHTSLISDYIWGADINIENLFANIVLVNSFWNSSIYNNYNAMLSITILGPILSIILKMNLPWVFKLIYPTIYSLVPLGLFIIIKKQTNDKIAFLSSFFFMSFYAFYTVMPALARQEIAELFFILLIGLIINQELSRIKNSILIVILSISLIVSHYGLTYIFILMMITAYLLKTYHDSNFDLVNYSKKIKRSVFTRTNKIFSQLNIFFIEVKSINVLNNSEKDKYSFSSNKNNYAILNITNNYSKKIKNSIFTRTNKIFSHLNFFFIGVKSINALNNNEKDKYPLSSNKSNYDTLDINNNFDLVNYSKKIKRSVFTRTNKIFSQLNIFFIEVKSINVLNNSEKDKYSFSSNKNNYAILDKFYLIFSIVFALTWFMIISSSSIFDVGVDLGNSILSSISDIFDPSLSQGASIITSSMPMLMSLEKFMDILAQLLITIGIILITVNKKLKFNFEYKYFAVASLIIVSAGIILPFFAAALNSDRLYQIALFFLAPAFVIGFVYSLTIFIKYIKKFKININLDENRSLYILSVFLIIFFLFNSSFVYQIFDQPKVGRFALDNNVDFLRLDNPEISSAEWFTKVSNNGTRLYADINKATLLIGGFNLNASEMNITDVEQGFSSNSYIFLSTFDIKNKQLSVYNNSAPVVVPIYVKSPDFGSENYNRIYDNGWNEIIFEK